MTDSDKAWLLKPSDKKCMWVIKEVDEELALKLILFLFYLDFHTQLSETLKDRQTGWQQLAETKNSLIRKVFNLLHPVPL